MADGIGPGGLAFALAAPCRRSRWWPRGRRRGSARGVLALATGGTMRLAYGRRLGGYTGDCLGALQQTSEVGLLPRRPRMSLILLRHTRPAGPAGLLLRRTELALGPRLPRGSGAAGQALPRFSRVIASPSLRCRRLAERLAAAKASRRP